MLRSDVMGVTPLHAALEEQHPAQSPVSGPPGGGRNNMTDALRLRSMLALGVSAATLGFATHGFAVGAAPSENTIQQVIVTASGRQAKIQDVAIPITAVTADTLKNGNITDLKGVANLVPSYKLEAGQSNAAGATASIRGIGTGGDNAGFESAVGFFIDGVYRNRAGVALSELPEVERIEVLRGPQGTLFGRNTSAGAISVTTKGPDYTSTHGFLEGSLGNFNDRKGTFAFNTPLIDHVLAVRLDGNYEKRDGYITDVNSGRTFNNKNRWSLRGQLRWEINDDASLRIIADTSHTDEQCCVGLYGQTGAYASAINTVAGLFDNTVGIQVPTNSSSFKTALSPNRDYKEKIDEYGLSAELNWTVKDVKLSSITSYRDWKALRDQDIDFNGSDRAYRQGYTDQFKTFTEELRAQGQTGRLNWLVGGFYADEILPHTDKIKFGNDGAHYVDALASGVNFNTLGIPAFVGLGSGYNVFGSLGTAGCGAAAALVPNCRLFQPIVKGSVITSLLAKGVPLAIANAQATAIANAYSAGLASGIPVAGTGQNADQFKTHTQSASIFTHDELQLTEKLKLTVGLRFNHEQKDLSAGLNASAPGCNALYTDPAGIPAGTFAGITAGLNQTALGGFLQFVCNPVVNTAANGAYKTKSTEDELSGTTSLSYKLDKDVMVYGGYSHGYKAGGYNLDRSGLNVYPGLATQPSVNDLHFNPEFTDSFELGVKSTIFGNTQLNANIFYEDISDFQSNNFTGFNFITKNVPTTISKGVEIDYLTRPMDGLTLQGGLLYNDASYESSVSFGTSTITKGQKIAGAPHWTLTSAATYRYTLPYRNLVALFYLDGRYVSDYQTTTLSPSTLSTQTGFAVFNGRIGISPPNERWSLEFYGRNLTDKFYALASFGVPEQTGNYAVYPGQPRTYGATLRVKY